MFERDYLMNLLMQFFRAMLRVNELKHDKDDPESASKSLEDAIENALEMEGIGLLSLAPESMTQIMQVSGVDPNITQFVARSLLLDSVYLNEAGQHATAALRVGQAQEIARAYGFELPEDPSDFEKITEGLEEAALAGGFDLVEDDPFLSEDFDL